MATTPDDSLNRTFTAAEIEAMRRGARDEKKVFSGVWTLLRRVGSHIPFAEDVLAAYYCALDPTTERRVKLVLVGALGYFVMPFDILPDLLPLIGFTDDAAVIATAIATVTRAIRPEHREKARETLERGL